MKMYGEQWRGVAPLFLALVLDRALLLYPGAYSPGTHSVGGWVAPRAGLDIMEKRKIAKNQTPTR
jgi:hypothetical protein